MPFNHDDKDFAAQTATANGPAHDTQGFTNHTLVTISNGTTTSGVIKLQGSADKTNWYDLATRTLTVAGNFSDSVTGAHKWVRAAITTVIGGGGTVDVWVTSSGPLPNDSGWTG
jgi:hypothetical protein